MFLTTAVQSLPQGEDAIFSPDPCYSPALRKEPPTSCAECKDSLANPNWEFSRATWSWCLRTRLTFCGSLFTGDRGGSEDTGAFPEGFKRLWLIYSGSPYWISCYRVISLIFPVASERATVAMKENLSNKSPAANHQSFSAPSGTFCFFSLWTFSH